MERAQLQTDDGGGRERALSQRRATSPVPSGEVGLGDVAKDVIGHLRVIAGDSIAIGTLEAKKALRRVEDKTRAVAPRVMIGAAAALLGLAGVVLGLIAIFIALGEVIPSVAVRLGIYAVVFLLVAMIGGFAAAKDAEEVGTESSATVEK